jgi:hypothetical protein
MSIGRGGVGLEPHRGAGGAPSAAAVLAWALARDAALRGLVHALSNRVGTVAAVAGMLDGGPPPESVGTAARVLAGEGERLEALLAAFRLATADPFGADAAPEPLHVPELLGEVAALAGYALPDAAFRVDAAADVRPAVASRAALAHALLALAYAGAGGGATLRAGAAGGAVAVEVAPDGGADAAPGALAGAVEAAAWLLAPSGGAAAARGGGAAVTAPALGV